MAEPKLTPEAVLWTQQDAIATRNFLAGTPRFIQRLQANLPKIEGKTMEERAMTGSEAKGWNDCINEIWQMQADVTRGGVVDRAGYFSDEEKS